MNELGNDYKSHIQPIESGVFLNLFGEEINYIKSF
jgi:hypothetical protein